MPHLFNLLVRNLFVHIVAMVLFTFFFFYSCSVSCCRQHRTQNCEVASKPPESSDNEAKPTTAKFPTEDTVATEKLELLSKYFQRSKLDFWKT